jgi:hypothetical protein
VYSVNGSVAFAKNGELNIAAEMVGQRLRLTYATPGQVQGNLQLLNGTQNWQGPMGSFAAPKTIEQYAKMPTGVANVVMSSLLMNITVDAAGLELYQNGIPAWTIVETGATLVTCVIDGITIVCDWSVVPLVGETLRIDAVNGFWLNEVGGGLTPGDYVIN